MDQQQPSPQQGAGSPTSPQDDGAELDYGPSMDPGQFASPAKNNNNNNNTGGASSPPQTNDSMATSGGSQMNTPGQNQLAAPAAAGGANNNNNTRRAPKKIHPAEEPPIPARPVPIPTSDVPPRLRGLYGKAELLFYSVVLRRTASGLFSKSKPGLLFLTPAALFILDMSFMVTRYVPVGEIASPCGVFEQTKQVLLKPINEVEILVSFPDPNSQELDENSRKFAQACGNRGLAQFIRCLYAAHFFATRPADVPPACNPPLRLTKMPPDVMQKSLSRSARANNNSADRQAKIEMRLKNEMNKNSGITRPHAAQQSQEEGTNPQGEGDDAQRDQEGAGAAGNFQPDMKLKQLAEQYVDEDEKKRQAALAAQGQGSDGMVVGANGERVPPVVALAQKYATNPNDASAPPSAQAQGQQQQSEGEDEEEEYEEEEEDVGDEEEEYYEEEDEEGASQYTGSSSRKSGASSSKQRRSGKNSKSNSQTPSSRRSRGTSKSQSQTPSRATSEYSHPSNAAAAANKDRSLQSQQPNHPNNMSASNFMSPQQAQQNQMMNQMMQQQQPSSNVNYSDPNSATFGMNNNNNSTSMSSAPVGQQYARTGALPRVRAPGNRESLAMMALCYASFVRVADFSLPDHLARTPSGAPHPIMPYLLQSVLFTINPTGNAIFWRPMVEAPLWSFNALHDVEAIHFRRGGLISLLVRPYGGRSVPCKMTIQPMLYRPNIGGPQDPDELKTVEADITIPAEREELIRSAKSLLEVLHALAPNVQFTVDRPDSSSRTTSRATSARDGSQFAGSSSAHTGTHTSDRSPSQTSSQQTGSAVANALGPSYKPSNGRNDNNNRKNDRDRDRHHHGGGGRGGRHHHHDDETTDRGSSYQSGSRYTDDEESETHRSHSEQYTDDRTRTNDDSYRSSQSPSYSRTNDTPRSENPNHRSRGGRNDKNSNKKHSSGYPMDAHRELTDDGYSNAGKGDRSEDYDNSRDRDRNRRGGGNRDRDRNNNRRGGSYDDSEYTDDRSQYTGDDSEYDDRRGRGGGRGGGHNDRRNHNDRGYDDRRDDRRDRDRDRGGRGGRRDDYDDYDDRRGGGGRDRHHGGGGGGYGRPHPNDRHRGGGRYDDEYSEYTEDYNDYPRGGGGRNNRDMMMPPSRHSDNAVSAVLRGVPVSQSDSVAPIEKNADVPVDAVKIMSEVDWRSIIQQDPVTAATVMADAQQQWEMERAAIAHELLRMHEERSLLLGQNDALQHQVAEILDGRGNVVVDVQKLSQQCFQLQQQLQAERKIRQQSIDDNVYKTERFFEGVIVSQQDEVDVLKERLRRLEGVLERVGDAAGSSPKYKYSRGALNPVDESSSAPPPPGMTIGSDGPFSPSAIGYHPSTATASNSSMNAGNSPAVQYPPNTTSGPLATSPNVVGSAAAGGAPTPNQAFMKNSPGNNNNNSNNNNNNFLSPMSAAVQNYNQQQPNMFSPQGQPPPQVPPNSPYYGGPSPPRPGGVNYMTSPYATPSSRQAILNRGTPGSNNNNDQSLRYSLMMDT